MKQKTVTLLESHIDLIQTLANDTKEGDFSRMLRKVIAEWNVNENHLICCPNCYGQVGHEIINSKSTFSCHNCEESFEMVQIK